MIVHKSRLLLDDDEARIVASVTERGRKFRTIRACDRCATGLCRLARPLRQPIRADLLLLAGVLGESASTGRDGFSAASRATHEEACATLPVVVGNRAGAVEAEAQSAARRPGEGNALFFTRGVDSWQSALRELGPANCRDISRHFLYAPDLDRQYSPPTRRRAYRATREAAAGLGLPLIPVSHNGRELLDRFVNWERSHGGVLAGIGLALGGWFANVRHGVIATTSTT